MAPLFTIIVIAIVGVFSLLVFSIWGIPIVLLSVLIGGFYIVSARKSGKGIGGIERGKRIEPTGRPRKASGGAETANQRVGHP